MLFLLLCLLLQHWWILKNRLIVVVWRDSFIFLFKKIAMSIVRCTEHAFVFILLLLLFLLQYDLLKRLHPRLLLCSNDSLYRLIQFNSPCNCCLVANSRDLIPHLPLLFDIIIVVLLLLEGMWNLFFRVLIMLHITVASGPVVIWGWRWRVVLLVLELIQESLRLWGLLGCFMLWVSWMDTCEWCI
jgi:hypothetical protein